MVPERGGKRMANRRDEAGGCWWLALAAACLLGFGPAAADDMMEFVGEYTPSFFTHWLDVHMLGTTAYVPGWSGLSLFNVQGPSPPEYLGRYAPPSGVQFYHATPSSPYSFCSARANGLWVVNVTNPGAPSLIHHHDEGNTSFEGLLVEGDELYVATHEHGLRVYDVSDPTDLRVLGSVSGLSNTWAVAKSGRWVYLADGHGGLRVIDCQNPASPMLVQTVGTSGAAQDVVLKGATAYVACGAEGVDIYDISDPDAPHLLGNYASEHSSFLLATDPAADRIYIASWNTVEAVAVSDASSPVQAGFEDTPTRAMGIAADAAYVYVADWDSFRMYAFGPTTEPDIQLEPAHVSFPVIPPGESADTTLSVGNTGGGSLVVTGIATGSADFSASPTSFTVPAGGSQDIVLTVTASADEAVGKLRVASNDPDENNDPHPMDYGIVASDAYDFTLSDLGGAQYSLSDFRGDVVLLFFFASW
jgi:hypothetical protein